jgi:hypothetical protein
MHRNGVTGMSDAWFGSGTVFDVCHLMQTSLFSVLHSIVDVTAWYAHSQGQGWWQHSPSLQQAAHSSSL